MLRSLAMAVVARCVIFHRRQLLLRKKEREPHIPPLPISSSGPLHRLPIPGHLHPSLFVLRVRLAPARAGQRTGHATGHQLHDLRFADLASGVHRHAEGDACAGMHRARPRVIPAVACGSRWARAYIRTRVTHNQEHMYIYWHIRKFRKPWNSDTCRKYESMTREYLLTYEEIENSRKWETVHLHEIHDNNLFKNIILEIILKSVKKK